MGINRDDPNIYLCSLYTIGGFPGGSVVKNPAAKAGDKSLILRSRRSPGEGNGNPLQYSCLEIPWIEEPGRLQSTGLQKSWT